MHIRLHISRDENYNVQLQNVNWMKPETGKDWFLLQSQRKAIPKNAQTTTQLHSSHMLESNAQNSSSQASAICEP